MKTKVTFLILFTLSLFFIPTLLISPAQAQGPNTLTITKTVALTNDPAQPGDPITYTIVISNNEAIDVTNAHITDTLPSEVDGNDLDVTTTVTASDRITFTINATVTTTISPGVTITNTAYYSHTGGSNQDNAIFTVASTPVSTAAFEIVNPTTANPAYAGSISSTQKIVVKVTKLEDGLTSDKFMVTIGGISATIVTLYEGSDVYVLEVTPPTQPANGLYDLEVSIDASSGSETATEVEAVYYNDTSNIDVMLVIDRSGSMEFEDNISKAKDAAMQFVDLMSDGDQIGLASFSDNTSLDFELTAIVSDTQTQAKEAIDPLAVGGFTTIGGGLQIAQDELTAKGEALHPWAIVLMSDGLENTAPFVAEVLPGIEATKSVVHSIALGSLADKLLLQDIAALTGGTYNFAPTGTELAGIYNTIAGALTGQQTLVSLNGIVQFGATDEKQVVVDSTVEQATFSVSWPTKAAQLELTLEDPNGAVIDSANPDVDFVEGTTYQYYRVISPTLVAGVWKMKISDGVFPVSSGLSAAVTAAASGVPYTVQVMGDSPLNIHSYIDDPHVQPGNDIKISITLSDNQPISGAEVLAVVGPFFKVNPLSGAQAGPNPILPLYDDGGHGDGAAGDGVYANTLPSSQTGNEGVYNFTVFANGTSNGGQDFARESRISVLVGADSAPFLLSDTFQVVYLPLITK